jgi:hypothetical protein
MLVLKIVFWSFFATIVACVEIEAEGKYGWAEKMPTWYRVQGFLPRLFGFFMNGKPLTGYHAFMFFVPLLIFHVPFVSGIPWTGPAELQALAMYFAWSVLWDYHWFVLNPHYAGRFSKDRVWWHKKSPWVFGIFPLDYLGGLAASFIAAGTGSLHRVGRRIRISIEGTVTETGRAGAIGRPCFLRDHRFVPRSRGHGVDHQLLAACE